jgi:hypothetical protein
MEDLKNNLNYEKNCFIDQSYNFKNSSFCLPSQQLIQDAISNNDFTLLDDMIVIPSIDSLEPIKFSDDIWTNYNLRTQNEAYRKANFESLPISFKSEIKVIGVYLLWFGVKKSKLSSTIRIIENLILISKYLVSVNVKSIFWLDREPIQKKFISDFTKGRSSGTIDNYFKSLSRLCDMKYTFFCDVGFYLKTNYKSLSATREDNQTYCMPMRILYEYWNSYIKYFDNLLINKNNWAYICKLNKRYRQYLLLKNLNKHHSRWMYFLSNHCQPDLEVIYNDTTCVTSNLVRKQELNGRLKYSDRYPKYIVRQDDIHDFYNKNALIACEVIQAMTGMRKSETVSIKFSSLIDENDWVGVKSVVYKNADEGGIEECWAASPYIKKVFSIITLLAKELYDVENFEDLYIKTDARSYMFRDKISLMRTQRNSENLLQWSEKNKIKLTESDVKEFWKLNPNIARPEDVKKIIKVGMIWPVRSHQYRRSIVVHLRRLDLVNMNHIIVQLKHLGKTVAAWYSEGALANSTYLGRISESFAKELELVELEFSASLAMKLQQGENLFGRGGKQLELQKDEGITKRTFQSFNHAKSLAKRKKKKVMSLGNGMYCLNGIECDFQAIAQSSNCRLDCENLVADRDSIPIWIARFNRFRYLYLMSVELNKPEASQEFLRLEMEFYKEALEFYEVIL